MASTNSEAEPARFQIVSDEPLATSDSTALMTMFEAYVALFGGYRHADPVIDVSGEQFHRRYLAIRGHAP
jgi:hypothetical protein